MLNGSRMPARKNTVKGDPESGKLKLYGNRVDMQQLMANPTAPELLQRQFKEIKPSRPPLYVTGPHHDPGSSTFPVAQAWHAFARDDQYRCRMCAELRATRLKIHRIWDATGCLLEGKAGG